MSYIHIQHYLTDEDKAIIIDCLKHDFPVSMMIGDKEQPVITCEHCKYRTRVEGYERFTRSQYYCGYEYERCDPYEMTRNANDPNYFCADAIRRES